jgi:hypothetical protein
MRDRHDVVYKNLTREEEEGTATLKVRRCRRACDQDGHMFGDSWRLGIMSLSGASPAVDRGMRNMSGLTVATSREDRAHDQYKPASYFNYTSRLLY